MTGERVPAAAALARGFVDEVVPRAAAPCTYTDELVTRLAARPTAAVRAAKAAVWAALDLPLPVGLAREADLAATFAVRAEGRARRLGPRSFAPESTALLLMELKRLTVGDRQGANEPGAPGAPLGTRRYRDGVGRRGRPPHASRTRARFPSCTARRRSGPMARAPRRMRPSSRARSVAGTSCSSGSPNAEPAVELLEPGDLRSVRFHGVAPFIGTDLDPQLPRTGASPRSCSSAARSTWASSALQSRPSTSGTAWSSHDRGRGGADRLRRRHVRAHHANARLADQRRRVAHDLVVGTARASRAWPRRMPTQQGIVGPSPWARPGGVRQAAPPGALEDAAPAGSTSSVPRAGERRNGMTINWVTQLSFDPKLGGRERGVAGVTHQPVGDGGVFSVNLVPQEDRAIVEVHQAGRGRSRPRARSTTFRSTTVRPVPRCSIRRSRTSTARSGRTVEVGGHTLFLGEIVDCAFQLDEDTPVCRMKCTFSA